MDAHARARIVCCGINPQTHPPKRDHLIGDVARPQSFAAQHGLFKFIHQFLFEHQGVGQKLCAPVDVRVGRYFPEIG